MYSSEGKSPRRYGLVLLPTVASNMPRKNRAASRLLNVFAAAVLATTAPHRKTFTNTGQRRVKQRSLELDMTTLTIFRDRHPNDEI